MSLGGNVNGRAAIPREWILRIHLSDSMRSLQLQQRQGTTVTSDRPRLSPSPINNRTAVPDRTSQLAAIVEFSSDAIFSRTFDGTVTTWNQAARRMFGYSADEIVGRSCRVLLPPGRREEYRHLAERIRSGETVQHFETERVRRDRTVFPVSLALSPIKDATGRLVGVSTIARDMTEQRQMREALQRSERELTDLFEEASLGLMWISPEGTILRANRALLSLLQCRPKQCLGWPLRRFHAEAAFIHELLTRLAGRQSLRNLSLELVTTRQEIRPVMIDANAFWEKGRLVHSRWFVRDLSQRKRLEREVLELSDRERRSFAQELHDGLGQQLGGIAYLTNVVHERLTARASPEAGEVERIFVLVRNAIEQTRRLARGLSPIRLEPEGLTDALGELAAQTSDVFGVCCNFQSERPIRVEDSVLAGHFYRIAQEAVNNALKHARAKKIVIRLKFEKGLLSLAVEDDGKGFVTPSPSRSGLGLRIMQYRADLVRGRLAVGPRPKGKGTKVTCVAPCSSETCHETETLR